MEGLTHTFDRLRKACDASPEVPWATRADRLARLKALVADNAAAFALAISADFGHRSAHETDLLEVFPSLSGINHALSHGRRWMRGERRATGMWFLPARSSVTPQPLGVAGIILLRHFAYWRERFVGLPSDSLLDERAYRFMAVALIFDSLGIVAGAIWAQDAWGRYWQWDPLETWSLITWLALALSLHVRTPFKTAPTTNALLIVGVFVIAFFTFFGIPFVSTSLHQGQV